MFEYFYHENIRNVIIAFATLFNNIYVRETDSSGNVTKNNKVPIRYGPRSKFLARIDEAPKDLNNPVQITLPIISFTYNGLTYDPDRKITTTEYFTVQDPENPQGCLKSYMPVPYNMSLELNIMTKLEQDSWQIIEQILPYFQPAYTLTIKYTGIKELKDVPIQIESIEIQDDYEGNYESRRSLIYTVKFTAKIYLFGPQQKVTDSIIRKSTIGFVVGSSAHPPNSDAIFKDITVSSTPVAVIPYSKTLAGNLTKDFLLNDTILFLDTVENITTDTIIGIGKEILKVTYINQTKNAVTVLRANYNSKQELHVSGSDVYKVVEADNDLIEPGDPFESNQIIF